MNQWPPMYYCGIDPGQSGGIALIVPNRPEWERGTYHDTSTKAWPMPDTERDIYDLLVSICPLVTEVTVYMEAVHSFPGQGVASSFTFGKGYGFLRGLIIAMGIPLVDVSPQKWKKALGLNYSASDSKKDKKAGSKQLAQQMFPHLKITHAISEALLIAEFGRRQK